MKTKIEKVAYVNGCGEDILDGILDSCNYEASGDGVVYLDTDSLENSSGSEAGKVMEALPKGYQGPVVLLK